MKFTYKHTVRACYIGYITQAIVNNLAPLLFIIFQDRYQISFEEIGRLILINFGVQICADILAVKFADRIGHRKAAVGAHIFCAAGLVGLSVLPSILPSPYMGLVIAVIIYAVGGGLLEVLVSPIVDSLPGDAKASAMSLLHSFYCWGQMAVVLLTTLLLRLIGQDLWMLLPILWALVPFANLFLFMKVPLVPPIPDDHRTPLKGLLQSRFFLLALILMMCSGAAELTMSQWSSLFAEKGLHVPKMVGDLLGPCLFALFQGLGRTFYGVFGQRINLTNALLASGGLCILCYATTVFVPSPMLSLAGCALCGLSVSLMWPGTLSLTAARFPSGGTAMFGMLAIFGDIGASLGPWLAGLTSDLVTKTPSLVQYGQQHNLSPDQVGLKGGLLIGMVFPLILFVVILAMKLLRRRNPAVRTDDTDDGESSRLAE